MLRRIRDVPSLALSATICLFASLALAPLSCTTEEPTPSTYFDQTIAPILTNSCVRTNTGVGCHFADPKGNSLGNLDLSTFDGVNHRRDLLLNHGPYSQPSLLVKNISPFPVPIQSFDGTMVTVTTDIRHTGGPILDSVATGFTTLARWMGNGATQNNSGQPPSGLVKDACVSGPPPSTIDGYLTTSLGFDPNHDPSMDPGYATFVSEVQKLIDPKSSSTAPGCAAGNCHGTSTNVLYLLCGNNPAELRWDYWILSQYIPNPPSATQLLSRPLTGSTFHEGGAIFKDVTDPNYKAFLDFAIARGPATYGTIDPNLAFFAHRVQPILVRKGCMMVQCHSPAMFHEYRLRGGTGGAFSYLATLRNYNSTLLQLSLESDDVRASRLVRKNLFRPNNAGLPPETPTDNGGGNSLSNMCGDAGIAMTMSGDSSAPAGEGGTGNDAGPAGPGPTVTEPFGIAHRGGSLFEDFCLDEPTGAACDNAVPPYNYDTGDLDTIPAFCVIREWHKRERATRNLPALSGIAYVQRTTPAPSGDNDRAQDFDVFAPGAALHIATAIIDPTNDVQLGGVDTPFDLTKCGLSGAADVRRPAVSWDGTKLAFAARTDATKPLQIYEIDLTSNNCTLHPLNGINDPDPSKCQSGQNGLLAHNFDPAYAPDGRLVFASTRGNLDEVAANFDYCGPQRTPADPSKPNSNLYVYEPDPNNNNQPHLRQLTYLLNMERYPTFMSDGRLIFTTEKREPGFYQLAVRRINLDGGDYHPLYAQRGTIGDYEAIYPIELADKDFAAIFSNPKSLHGAGALVVFNRSIGVDFHSTNAADYLVDPTVITPGSASYLEDGTAGTPAFFLHSLDNQLAQAGTVYTSPSALPGGKMIVSVGQGDPTSFNGTYNVVVFDPENPTAPPHQLFTNGVEAVGIYARTNKGVFASTPDEPNGHTMITSGTLAADVTVLDMPVLASLLFQNTPTGRLVENFNNFDVYEELPADSATPDATYVVADKVGWTGSVFVKRRLLGNVKLAPDGSAHVLLPGGVPLVLHLPDTPQSMSMKLPRYQKEEMEFAPGEVENQAFSALPDNGQTENFFNGLCGNCHGSVSGRQLDVAVKPDMLTQASMVASRGATAQNLNITPAQRPKPVPPPSSP